MRSMALEFPEDPFTSHLDKQYLLGDSLLVAPVLHETKASYYVPAGKWTDLWTGEVVEGPKFVTEEDCPLDRIPVFVRPGSIILLGPKGVDVPDYKYAEVELEVRAYQIDQDTEVEVPTGAQDEIAGKIKVKADGSIEAKGFKVVKGDLSALLAQ